jgi:hypothetical protein
MVPRETPKRIVTMQQWLNPIELITRANLKILADTLKQVNAKLTLWNAAMHIGLNLDALDENEFILHPFTDATEFSEWMEFD